MRLNMNGRRLLLMAALISWVRLGSAAEGPGIEPHGGTFEGPVFVTITAPSREGQVRVTVDGSEPAFEPYALDGSRPMTQSYAIRAPFRLATSATVKARVFGADKQPLGPTSEVAFVIRQRLRPGVPFHPVDWSADVETWWSRHPMNPKSPQPFAGPVESPPFRVNVADARRQHPETTTAGIEEALAMLPAEGGTLWFPKDQGPYVITKPDSAQKLSAGSYLWGGAIKIRNRSNLHFLSDGAAIRCDHTAFGIAGGEFDRFRQVEHPAVNYYFQNLVFDGNGQAGTAMLFPQEGENFHILNTTDMMFDQCRFVGSVNPRVGHGGLVSLAFKSDNIWFRDCFFESGMWGVYWDGVHGGGLVNCTFTGRFTNGGFVLFTNDDLSPFDFRLRSAQYVVVAGCTFGGPDEPRKYNAATAFHMAGEKCLFTGNTVNHAYRTGVSCDGKLAPDIRPYRYHYTGNRIVDNRFRGVDTLLLINSLTYPKTISARLSDYLVRDNDATDLQTFAELAVRPGAAEIENVRIEKNRLAGRNIPQLIAKQGGVRGARVTGNTFAGQKRAMVVGPPEGLPPDAVVVEANTFDR